MPSLYSISLYGNDIKDISTLSFLKNSKNLARVNLGYNQIEDISTLEFLSESDNFQSLNLSGNKIVDISVLENLKYCDRLYDLNLSNNKIKDISVLEALMDCKYLEYLYLGNNNISDIRVLSLLAGKKRLYHLDLSSNNIMDLSPLATLSECPNLNELNLGNNGLTDLTGIEELVNLRELDVSYNQLTVLPDLTALVNLDPQKTRFYGNQLTADELRAKMPIHLALNQTWVNENRYDEYQWGEAVVVGYDREKIVDLLADEDVADVKVILDPKNMSEVDSEVFKIAAQAGKGITFDIVDDSGKTIYKWFFDGNNIDKPDMDMDLTLDFETEKKTEIEELIGRTDVMYLSFAHHGELPGSALMTVYVGDQYDDGEIIYLYYYNEEEKVVELMSGGLYVYEGYVTFVIKHCSDYFLLDEMMGEDDNEESGVTEPESPGTTEPTEPDDKTVYTTAISDKISVTEIIKALRSDEFNSVNVILTKPDVVTTEIFKVLRETEKTVSFIVIRNGKTLYQWTFDGKDLTNADMELDLTLTFKSERKAEIDKLTGQQDAVYLSFAHRGELPGRVKVTIYVGDTFADGEVLYLYYYNEDTGKLELVERNGLLVENGYVVFGLDHCAEYVLVSEKVSMQASVVNTAGISDNGSKNKMKAEAPATGDNNSVWFLLLMLVVAGALSRYMTYDKLKKKMM